MNAVNHPVSPMGTLRWLLKREYWENRGGFLYAPLIAGLISLVMSTIGIAFGLFALHRAARDGGLHIDGEDVNINGLDLALLTRDISAKDLADLGNGLDLTLVLSSAWPFLVLAFVVFFYCLGALYDDRRDRSILFWKSLPLSDTQTVLSKVISALIGLYEPHMGDVDWQTATIEDHINLTLALAGTDASAIPDATQCQTDAAGTLDFTGQTEEGAELFLAIAERESPEVASYFSVILEARQQVDKESTGDCQTDIATFQGYVDGGVPFMELQLGDQLLILGLMNSIGFCSLQTQGELMFAPATQEFLAGSPFAGE